MPRQAGKDPLEFLTIEFGPILSSSSSDAFEAKQLGDEAIGSTVLLANTPQAQLDVSYAIPLEIVYQTPLAEAADDGFKAPSKPAIGTDSTGKDVPSSKGEYEEIYKMPVGIDPVFGSKGSANGDGFNNSLTGSSSNDVIHGYGGDDLISGLGEDDSLYGRDGDDSLFGGNGWDRLEGGGGQDLMSGGAGTDAFFGGAGRDTVDYSYASGNWRIDLYGGIAASLQGTTVEALHSVENAIGGSGDDVMIADHAGSWLFGGLGDDALTGNAFNDLLDGGQGADNMRGKAGDDLIRAGEDHDVVRDGVGDDVVYLGSGDDRFIWNGGTDEVYGGTGVNTFVIEHWVSRTGSVITEAPPRGDVTFEGGHLTIHEFDSDDVLDISHWVDLDHFGFADGAAFLPDTYDPGVITERDLGVRLIDGDLHIDLATRLAYESPDKDGTGAPGVEGSMKIDTGTLVLTDTSSVDIEQFVF
ncbi:MAG: calcium-binding protein [Pseudomonadota bacterium]